MTGADTAGAGRVRHDIEPPGPYRVPVPTSIAPRLHEASAVALSFEPNGGRPRLRCRPAAAASGCAVTRQLSARNGEATPGLTLPKQCIEAAGLVGSHALVYATAPDRLCIGFDMRSDVSDVSLSEIERSFVSRRRGGELAVSLSEAVAGPLSAAERLWFSLDHHGGAFLFAFDGAESVAPAYAMPVTVNPNTDRVAGSGLSLLFPRVVGRLCGVGSSTLRWGRTASGNRLLAVRAGE